MTRSADARLGAYAALAAAGLVAALALRRSELAAVAAAQQITVVNGGYTYDSELIERLPEVVPDLITSRFDPTELRPKDRSGS